MIQLTKTPILLNCLVPYGFFVINVNYILQKLKSKHLKLFLRTNVLNDVTAASFFSAPSSQKDTKNDADVTSLWTFVGTYVVTTLVCLRFFWGNERKYFTHIPSLVCSRVAFGTKFFYRCQNFAIAIQGSTLLLSICRTKSCLVFIGKWFTIHRLL